MTAGYRRRTRHRAWRLQRAAQRLERRAARLYARADQNARDEGLRP